MMEYRGYRAAVTFDDDAGVFHGEVVDTHDVITFQGESVSEFRQAFADSVDEYLTVCSERGRTPDKPFSSRTCGSRGVSDRLPRVNSMEYPPEGRTRTDPNTGVRVRQVTDHPSINHHPFYYLPAMDDAMHHLVFVSHRSGRPEIFVEVQEDGRLVQLTEHEGLAEWSVHPSHDGRHVYFTDAGGGWRVEVGSRREEQLFSFDDGRTAIEGQVGAAMGTTTVSHDDRWWAVPVSFGDRSRMLVVDTATGAADYVLEADGIGHPEFHPDDSEWFRYAGSYRARIWVARRDGSRNRLAYERDAAAKEWIVHETWRPGTREIVTTQWPHGMIGIDVDTGDVRRVCSFNAWHAAISRDGSRLVSDTTFPDNGLMLFDATDGVGEPQPLCASEATNEGAHWDTDHCPYDDGPTTVYAPQHTHPHPAFSPDGRQVVFTSDRGGFAQVYVAEVPEAP